RDDLQTFAAPPHRFEELGRTGQKANPVHMRAFELFDVEAQAARPMIEAIPRQRTDDGLETRPELEPRLFDAEPAHARVMLRNDLEPEKIIEREVEQRAVHVDEHGVDAFPIDDA